MGGGRSSSSQTTTTTLPANQQRNIDQLLNGALQYYNSGGREFFPGDLIADLNQNQVGGHDQLLGFAGGQGQDLINSAIGANSLFLDPNNIFNPSQMPGFQGTVDDLTRNYTTNLLENILPAVRGGATAAGQFGGSASGIGQALSVDRSQQALGDSLSNLYLGAYGQGLDSFNQAINRVPGLFQLGLAPGQVQSGVGDVQQNQAQREIQGEVARHEFEQNEPIFLLQLLRELTGQAGTFGGSTQTNSSQKTKGSPITQALGGALSLASMWNPASSLFGGLAPAATGGATGSGIFGGFGGIGT